MNFLQSLDTHVICTSITPALMASFPPNPIACEQAPSWRQAQQKFSAKHRASGACTHLPKSQLPPTRRTACQLQVSANQQVWKVKIHSKQNMIHIIEILVFACLFSQKNYLWLKKLIHETQNNYCKAAKLRRTCEGMTFV